MADIEAVVFDIGNVLIEWQPERFYDRVLGAERRAALFASIDLHRMNDEVDRGAEFDATVTRWVEEHPDWAPEIQMWHDHWIDMAAPAIDHSVRLLRALRRNGVPVFALSNFGRETFEIGEAAYPFLEEFDRRFLSGEMGVTKPDPRIYERVEEGCGLPSESLLFADDREENVEAARIRGWRTHLFHSPEGWAGRLIDEGLLAPEDAE